MVKRKKSLSASSFVMITISIAILYLLWGTLFYILRIGKGMKENFLNAYTEFPAIFSLTGTKAYFVWAGMAVVVIAGIAGFIVTLVKQKNGALKAGGICAFLQLAVLGFWALLAAAKALPDINYHGGDKIRKITMLADVVVFVLYILYSIYLGVRCIRNVSPKAQEAVVAEKEEREEEKPVAEEKTEKAEAKEAEAQKNTESKYDKGLAEDKAKAEEEEKAREERAKAEEAKEKAEEEKVREEKAKAEEEEQAKKEEAALAEKSAEGKEAAEPVTEPSEEQDASKEPIKAEEEKPAEEKVKEEPKEEAKPVAPVIVAADSDKNKDSSDFVRISFEDRLAKSDQLLKDEYKEIHDYALSYGIKSRVTFSGDTFRAHTVKYLKIIVAGKKLKLYYKLDPKKYEGTTIPYDDVSDKKLYKDIPFAFKVRSDLSVKRAKALIDDMMKEAGFTRKEPKKAVKPAENKNVAAAEPVKDDSRYAGKYEVFPEAGYYKFRLKASNGEILLVSNGYISKDGAKNGIDTLKKNIPEGRTQIVTDKNGFSQFRIYTPNDARLVIAGEIYNSAAAATKALASVERFATTDKIDYLDAIPEAEVREFVVTLPEPEKKDNGKLEYFIDDETKKWKGRLVASNGEVLFVTAAYASKQGAISGIEAIRKQFDDDSIHIVRDKQNRYQFKVITSNGQILVMGESYSSKDAAANAANSARAFLPNAVAVDLTKKAAEPAESK